MHRQYEVTYSLSSLGPIWFFDKKVKACVHEDIRGDVARCISACKRIAWNPTTKNKTAVCTANGEQKLNGSHAV